MNELSWLLYFATVSGTLKVLFFMGAGVCATLPIIMMIIWASTRDDYDVRSGAKERPIRPKIALYITMGILLGFTAALLPGRDTVYAIAASEMGEQALKTPLAGKAEKALEAWLDRQIAPAATTPAEK